MNMGDTTKINELNILGELSSKYSEYSETVEAATRGADTQLKSKIEGSETNAINRYIEIVNELSNTAFVSHPQHIRQLSQVLEEYEGNVEGAGFDKIVKSDPSVVESYAKILTTTQVTQIETPSNEAKGIIDGISFLDSTKIETYLTTLEEEMLTLSTTYTTTADTLSSELTSVISSLESVKADLDSDQDQMNRFAIMSNPTTGIKPSFIKSFKNGDELEGTLSAISKKGDAEFVQHMKAKDYDKMFSVDPDNVSEAMYALLNAKILDMVEFPDGVSHQRQKELEDFMNALLKQPESYIEGHAFNISVQNELMMAQYVGSLLLEPPIMSEDERKKAMEQVRKGTVLGPLWEAIILVDTPTVKDGNNPYHRDSTITRLFNLDNLYLSKDSFNFDLVEKRSEVIGGKVYDTSFTKTYKASALANSSEVQRGKYSAKLTELREAKTKAVEKMLKDSLISAVGIFSPGLKTGIAFLDALSENFAKGLAKGAGSASKIPGFEDHKDMISGITGIAENGFALMKKLQGLDKDISGVKKDLLNSLLDSGGFAIKDASREKDGIVSVEGKATLLSDYVQGGLKVQMNINLLESGALDDYLTEKTTVDNFNRLDLDRSSKEAQFILGNENNYRIDELDIEKLLGTLEDFCEKAGASTGELDEWLAQLRNDTFEVDGLRKSN